MDCQTSGCKLCRTANKTSSHTGDCPWTTTDAADEADEADGAAVAAADDLVRRPPLRRKEENDGRVIVNATPGCILYVSSSTVMLGSTLQYDALASAAELLEAVAHLTDKKSTNCIIVM